MHEINILKLIQAFFTFIYSGFSKQRNTVCIGLINKYNMFK